VIWVVVAVALAADVEWRRVVVLVLALTMPIPMLGLISIHWWRTRPDRSMRAPTFCEAVANEIRAGASLRHAVETAARSVDAPRLADLASLGASMEEVGEAAGVEFPEIGVELGALLARARSLAVTPAALFDELGNLGLARVEVRHEIATATAPPKAAGVVLLAVPTIALSVVLGRGGLEPYLARPPQRAAALAGLSLTLVGLCTALLMLRRAR
jgi:Flp pilus assembly protein TadB